MTAVRIKAGARLEDGRDVLVDASDLTEAS